jgi:hypothetical protein
VPEIVALGLTQYVNRGLFPNWNSMARSNSVEKDLCFSYPFCPFPFGKKNHPGRTQDSRPRLCKKNSNVSNMKALNASFTQPLKSVTSSNFHKHFQTKGPRKNDFPFSHPIFRQSSTDPSVAKSSN